MIYAVNKRTREHKVVPDYFSQDASFYLEDDGERWDIVRADADGWVEWEGGECPLPIGAACEYRINGETCVSSAHLAPWDHLSAYRPILDADTNPRQATLGGQSLWQDAEGTIPCREGDPVGRVDCDETGNSWTSSGDARPAYRELTEPPAWDGEGLPPAGIRCEALRSHGWIEVYVVGYCEDGYCVFDTGSEFKGNKDPSKFRPILNDKEQDVSEQEWNGEGLPPVGCECECYIPSRDVWAKVKIVAHDGDVAIFKNGVGHLYAGAFADLFRPIRSAEDKAIEEMARIIADGHGVYVGAHEAARRLYRAGYRKTAAADGEDV